MRMSVVGIISDTHGLMRPAALNALVGTALILHAGDVGSEDVLSKLRKIAPVVAVRGNMDMGTWACRLPPTDVAELGSASFYVLHDLYQLDLNPRVAGFTAVVSGHTHRAAMLQRKGVLYLNPGSAGPNRGAAPATLMRVTIGGPELEPEIVDLE
jgi:putative phosphoesterase